MRTTFSAEKVFNTAIMIERNGASFYHRAAEHAAKKVLRQSLLKLAVTEEGHMQTMARLKELLVGSEREKKWFDQEGNAVRYLRAFASSGIFNMTMDAAKALSEEVSVYDVLHYAMDRERDSIMFYTGIREAIPRRAGRDKIDAIIYEEMSHLVTLGQEIKRM